MTFDFSRMLSKSAAGLTALSLALTLGLAGASAKQAAPKARASAPRTAAQPKASPSHPAFGPGEIVLPYSKRVWAQTFSDVAPDPAIRFGTLPNGMRYAIMKNATPAGQASLRMVIQAGSLMERDDQQGLAHFLEHMAFNGSKNVPEGDMIKILERLGLAFGADTNASTGDTQTIYQLDLPRTNDETVDTSLMLFREAAGNLTIAQDAMDRERGVVLSEERSRDDPTYRLYKSELAFVMQDNLVVRRMPIGLPEILRNAPNTLIQDYYRSYYRPDRATLVAVGDFDVDTMEAKIKAKFGDWAPVGPAGPEPRLTLPVRRGPEAKVAVEPGSRLDVSINWVSPPDLSPDSKAQRTADLIESLGFAVLNRRFERLARSAEPPFIDAGAYVDSVYNTAKRVDIDMTGQPGRWREALNAAITEQRRIVQFGVTKAELDREMAGLRTAIASAAAQASTRRTPSLANRIAGSIDDAMVVTNPDQDLEMINAALAQVTVEKVNAAMREVFAGAGPYTFIGSPTEITGGAAAVNTAVAAALAAPVTAGADQVVKTWTHTSFGTPGKVAETRDITDIGTTFIRFENGVRLTVKPTRFRKEQISIAVRIGSGRLGLPNTRALADWAFPTAFIEGGLNDLTAEEVDQVMTSKIVGVNADVDDDAISMGGGTRPEDLDLEMQLMAAYVTAPGWRPEPFQRIKTSALTAHDQQDATAGGVLNREMAPLLRSGDKRWAFPSTAEIAATTLADVRALVDRDLNSGPIEIVIVGDTTVEKATAAVAATFGALPARPAAGWTPPPAPVVRFPAPTPTPVQLTHKGRADQSMGVMAWKTTDFFADPHKSRALRVLGEIFDIRLTEELREKQGATYSPQSSFSGSSVFPGFGYGIALEETPPQNLPIFFTTVESIAANLRDVPVTPDELNRAKAPLIESVQRQFDSDNSFWLGQLINAQTDPRRLPALRSALADLRTISVADIQAVAKEYLLPGGAWKLEIKAQTSQTSP